MTVTNFHTRYLVNIDWEAVSSPVYVGAITQQQLASEAEIRSEAQSGEIHRRFMSLVGRRATARFGTHQLAVALAECAQTGHVIENNGLIFYAQKYTKGSTPAAGSVHRKYTIAEGVLVPRTISCTHQGDAEIIYEAMATYDGSNAPIVEADSQSLPAAVADSERFTIGGVTIGSVSIDHIRQLDIDFGIMVLLVGADSDQYDTFAAVRGIAPSITLRGINIEWLKSTAIPWAGKTATHANTTIYLRKRDLDGFVADETEEHLKFTADGLCVVDTLMDDSGEQPGECSLTLPLRYDGTNSPLTVDTASAIT